MAEVDARHIELFAFDVFPHIQFRPVAQREHTHVFAGIHAGVVEVPDFGALVLRIPLPEAVAKAEKTFLRAGLFLVASRTADGAVETKLLDSGQQGGNLQAIAADFSGGRHSDAFGDGFLNVADDEFGAELLRATIAKFVQLGKMMAGIDVEQRHGEVRRPKSLFRQAQQANGVFAAREKERRPLEFGSDFAHDVNRLGLQILEVIEMV
jgi:hypothetical protein